MANSNDRLMYEMQLGCITAELSVLCVSEVLSSGARFFYFAF